MIIGNQALRLAIALLVMVTPGCAATKPAATPVDLLPEDVSAFDWLPDGIVVDTQLDRQGSDRLRRIIEDEVLHQMKAKGVLRSTDAPDVHVACLLRVEHTTELKKLKGTYQRRDQYWSTAVSQLSYEENRKGTLVIDFVEPKSKEVVWRTIGVGPAEVRDNPEEAERSLRSALADLLSSFPRR